MGIQMKFRGKAACLVALTLAVSATGAAAEPVNCGPEKLRQLMSAPPVTKGPFDERANARNEVRIDCHLNLRGNEVIRRKVVLEGPAASGVRVLCNGAYLNGGAVDRRQTSLEIRSLAPADGNLSNLANWKPPRDIKVQGCRIGGALRIVSMSNGGDDEPARKSSYRAGHAARARAAAPSDIELRNLVITARGWIPVYFSSGVTRAQLINSEINGKTSSVAIYLDSESADITIRGNHIHATTGREVLAIDGSERNLIVNNRFSHLKRGGIYLYRNCGERGTVRHIKPRFNQIINNVFDYDRQNHGAPAIYIGSRDGWAPFCFLDRAHPIGSGLDNRDFAQFNVVMGNQMVNGVFADRIKTNNPTINSPNFIAHNQTVATPVKRPAGCFVPSNFTTDFIQHGRTVPSMVRRDGRAQCLIRVCDDGVLKDKGRCQVKSSTFACQLDGGKPGCQAQARCPAGTTEIIGVTAACSLQPGGVDFADLERVAPGHLGIIRAPGKRTEAKCQAAGSVARWRPVPIRGAPGQRQTTLSCGGRKGEDCDIRGEIYCR